MAPPKLDPLIPPLALPPLVAPPALVDPPVPEFDGSAGPQATATAKQEDNVSPAHRGDCLSSFMFAP